MTHPERISSLFSAHSETISKTFDALSDRIVEAAQRMSHCLLNDGKILTCGNGGSCSEAMHLSSELLNRFDRDRPGLPAIALPTDVATVTSIANDYHYDDVFAKPIRALGHAQDLLVMYSTSGNSPNLLKALKAAHDRDMRIIALTGRDGGTVAALLGDGDLELRIPSTSTARIQEAHLLLTHCFCDLIDLQLFGE
jgi:D-sedoheptulose 7-phosphate isomerase